MKKGEIMSLETRMKISASRILQGNFRKGTKHSDATKAKMSNKAKGNTNGLGATWKHSKESKDRMKTLKLNLFRVKENHPRWIQDRSKVKTYADRRADSLYKQWSLQVKQRDCFKCLIADQNCKGKLESHHILNWVEFPELRYKLNNGITLCFFHHPRSRQKEKHLINLLRNKYLTNPQIYGIDGF